MRINFDSGVFMLVVGILLALALTVLAFIFVVPEKKRTKLGKIGALLHDTFNFKFLIIEKIIQALYIFSTFACIACGLCMLFGVSIYISDYYSNFFWYGGYGLLVMIGGPIVLRIVFELTMMFLLLVKNVMQINSKIKSEDGSDSAFNMPSVKDLFKKEAKAEPEAAPTVEE